MITKSRTVSVVLTYSMQGLVEQFSRDEIRAYARQLGVSRLRRTKREAAWEICRSGKGQLTISLGRKA